MIIVLIGPPGSGKGTYAQMLAKKGWIHFSMGQELREEAQRGGKYAEKIKAIQASGRLVPSEILMSVFSGFIKKNAHKNIILDGMPRTMDQANAVEKSLKPLHPVDAYFYIDAHEDEVKDRLKKRRQCSKCGKVYGKPLQPKKKGICDRCGGSLMVRNDDKPSVIHDRFKIYQKETVPVIDWASSRYPVFYIDGHGKPGVVFKRLVRLFPLLKE